MRHQDPNMYSTAERTITKAKQGTEKWKIFIRIKEKSIGLLFDIRHLTWQ